MNRLLVLGAGTAGTMMANKLARRLDPAQWEVTVVDRDDAHVYQPGLLFVPFGTYTPESLVRSRRAYVLPPARYVDASVEAVDPVARSVRLVGGESLAYDVLIVATGSHVHPERTPGLTGEGWYETAFDFYTLAGASALALALESFDGGRLVVHFADLPIKCPVAPLEFAFLAEAHLRARGLRDKSEIVYATPLSGPFTKPVASAALAELFAARGIQVEPDFAVESVDGAARSMRSYDGRSVDYDLLVTVPLHGGASALLSSGLTDEDGWVRVDKHTLRSVVYPEVWAIGDATDVPTSKAGSVAHFESEVLTENIVRAVRGRDPLPDFDGHANCFVETGDGKAILIDFNYETEPLPGAFPLPGVGPFSLLAETHRNHWGKLAFRWMYWNVLLAGDELPIDHRMLMAGKRRAA
ncbi:MAG: NAD(P)/FAD-dependent oxidoreductase [Myxococcales bacterium]|nr:NAD(P)/FAD-dependent oxidoreductase [Myxococcales bacterium]MCB9534184.1 NAD(P)/FAD-dependent oxidoreductase [Myxococcales bacterium]